MSLYFNVVGHGSFSPLTPALSPLRGEGARRTSSDRSTRLAASVASATFGETDETRRRAAESRRASCATPSLLNGERAGVRGEVVRVVSLFHQIESYPYDGSTFCPPRRIP